MMLNQYSQTVIGWAMGRSQYAATRY
jgi:hypothetical protein